MFARVLELTTKGKAQDAANTIADKILTILRPQAGFRPHNSNFRKRVESYSGHQLLEDERRC